MEDFAGDIRPGDVILLNDSYRGGTHLNDVTMLYPLFDERRAAHLSRRARALGRRRRHGARAATPGSSTNIYQEGVRIPPIKIVRGGAAQPRRHGAAAGNMRLPDERRGDFDASLGACRVAESRIRKLLARTAARPCSTASRSTSTARERRMREKIAALPDGEYVYEDYLEYYPGRAASTRAHAARR